MKQHEAGHGQMHASAAEFWGALKKGTGRAAILLQKDPYNTDLNAELLRACITDLTYDKQCEESRIPYLCELVQITGQADAYRDALENRLRAATCADPIGDTEQVFGILCRLAAGDSIHQAILRDFVLTTEDRALAMVGVPELVRLQGINALLACVRRFGPEYAEEPWLINSLTDTLEQCDDALTARTALQEARGGDAALDHLLRLAEVATSSSREPDTALDYAALKAELKRSDRKYFPYAWAKNASQEDIERAAEDLVAEADEAMVMAFLAIFRTRTFPGDPTRLFPLLDSANKRVARFTAIALARVSHPAVHSLALRFIAEGQFDLGARLLRSSHNEDDLVLFETLLDQLVSDEDAYHGVALSALYIVKDMAGKPEKAPAVLLHIYENGLCSLCRRSAVNQLATTNGIPDWIAEEGYYDAEPSIAQRFRPLRPQGG